ncbi:MAG: hypothetical protein WEB55_01435 [Acidimicrobiia bacterium]
MLKGERGASAVFVAGALVLLFGAAAVALDLGAGFNERRGNQTAVDTAAVGGMLWSRMTGSLQVGLDEAQDVVDANSVGTVNWAGCVDDGRLFRTSAALGLAGGTDCISWNSTYTTMRVRIPNQTVDTSFGKILGVETLSTFAVAEASVRGLGVGGSLPSGAFGGTGPGTEICIKTGTGPNLEAHQSCGEPSTGDFQNFLPYFYENDLCADGEQGTEIARTIAEGLDHYFGTAEGPGLGQRLNGDWCKNPPKVGGPAFPDSVNPAAGYHAASDVSMGLITGGAFIAPYDGRLDRGPYQSGPVGASDGFEIFEHTIDNRPLWSYFLTSGSLHQDCEAVGSLPDNPTFGTYAVSANTLGLTEVTSWGEAKELLVECLQNQSSQLFDMDEITSTPRLASVPRFWQTTNCPNQACTYDIMDFVPVFIQDMWIKHTEANWSCFGEVELDPGSHCRHMPGMTGEIAVAAPGQQGISSASAFILDCAHFTESVCKDVQDGTGGTTTILDDIRLTE